MLHFLVTHPPWGLMASAKRLPSQSYWTYHPSCIGRLGGSHSLGSRVRQGPRALALYVLLREAVKLQDEAVELGHPLPPHHRAHTCRGALCVWRGLLPQLRATGLGMGWQEERPGPPLYGWSVWPSLFSELSWETVVVMWRSKNYLKETLFQILTQTCNICVTSNKLLNFCEFLLCLKWVS